MTRLAKVEKAEFTGVNEHFSTDRNAARSLYFPESSQRSMGLVTRGRKGNSTLAPLPAEA